MINTNEEFNSSVTAQDRVINAKVIFNGTTELINEVISVALDEISCSESTLKIGEINTNKATVKFKMPDNKITLKNSTVKIYSGVNGVYVCKGTYYTAEIDKSDNSDFITVVAYDSTYHLNKTYIPDIEYPNSLSNVINDICSQCNILHDIKNIPDITIDGCIDNITCKQFLGYMMGLMGCNGTINPDDKLIAYWYKDCGIEITYDLQFMNGFNRTTDEDIVINSLTSGDSENVLVAGNGFGITFENPYMKQEILDSIFERIKGFTYTPCTVEWRGNPALEITDIVKVEDKNGVLHNVLLSEHTIVLTGMKSNITCKGETEIDTVMNQSPTDIKLNKLYATLTNAFKNTTDKILGNQGGYYRIDMNDEGFPSGWTIMNTPELRDDTHLWRFTAGGLGYSEDGGKTFKNLAFDLDGNFNANVITTGILQGEMFELDLQTGVIKIGKRDSEGEISNPSFYLNEKGELTIKAFEEIKEELQAKKYLVSLDNSGTVLNKPTDTITLSAKVYDGNNDETNNISSISFNWYRVSSDSESDKTWNNSHKGKRSIILTPDDVNVNGSFYCEITLPIGTRKTLSISITDNNDIANLGNSFLDVTGSQLVQILNTDGTYSPNWEINNITITPAVLDGLLNVDLSNCDIVFKKIINSSETGLTNGENVSNGILNVSKNIMTKANPAVTYVCYVSYKNTSIKLFTSFSLNVLGKDGADGSDGKDGAVGPQGPTGDDGVSVISITPYFAVNASSTTPPDSGWITAQPVRANGQYLWRKDTTKFSNNTTSTTIPFVITGDKGDTGPQGLQGIKGVAGADGVSSYFHIRYSQNANGNPMTDSAENAVYIGTCSTTSNTAPSSYVSYKWSKIKGDTGSKGEQGIQGPKGSDGQTSYLHIKYSDDGKTFTSNNGETPGKYIGTYVDFSEADSTVFNKYSWVKIEGPQGVQGPKGADGKQYYTWLKYADTPTSGMSDSPTGKAYIGLAYNKTTATESSNYSDYTWSLIKGEKGDTGIQGPKGTDGKTTYTWVKYATSASGANMSDDPSGKTYIGLAYNKTTLTESTSVSDYTWSLIKGDKGDKGDDGTVHSATAPSDKTKLWFDTTDNLLKYWNGTTWEVTNDFAGDINDMKQNITTEYTSAINQLKESLTTLVEKLQTTTTDNSTLIEQLSSQIVQNSSSISLVTNSIKSITDNISGLATKEEISQWARFENGVLELGASNSPFAVKLSNTELGFYQNGSRIAYLSNQQLNIEYAIVMTKLNIGTFSWNYDATDGLTLT